jgi:uncharacterized membrane protein YhiD involved in acid resistance
LNLDLELVLRIAVGTALGGVIGYERDIHGRPAGLRTHAVVALASATFMVVSTHMVYFQHYKAGDLVEVDGSRIAASVVSGIGFLAGGAILRNGATVQGLTTAAGLWLVAAIEGWSKDKIGSMRHLTLSVRLARDHGERVLIAILETEPGIVRVQLDPA